MHAWRLSKLRTQRAGKRCGRTVGWGARTCMHGGHRKATALRGWACLELELNHNTLLFMYGQNKPGTGRRAGGPCH